jgi:hypothetical protein
MGPQLRTRAIAFALTLALLLAAGGAWASTPGRSVRLKAPESPGIFEALWSWISPWLPAGSAAPAGFHPIWQKQEEGCGMDPNGGMPCPHSSVVHPVPPVYIPDR